MLSTLLKSHFQVVLGGVGGKLSHWRTEVPGRTFTATVTPTANGRVTVRAL
jgi:hypothetical protein